MQRYRFYILSGPDRSASSFDHDAEDDGEALQHAMVVAQGLSMEVWCGERFAFQFFPGADTEGEPSRCKGEIGWT